MKQIFQKIRTSFISDWLQVFAILIGCLPAFTWGYLFAWPSQSIPILTAEDQGYGFSLDDCSYLTVIPTIVAAIFCLLSGSYIDNVPRKTLLLFLALPQIAALILIATSRTIHLFYLSRVASGICDGLIFTVLPTYVGEIATPKVRGTWGNMVTLTITFGMLVVTTLGAYASIPTTALIGLVFPIVFLCSFVFMPESPYFLLKQGKREQAMDSLRHLRRRKDVEEEMRQLEADVQRQMSESGTWKDLFCIKSNRKSLCVAIYLRFAQQLSGIVCFVMFSPYIFGTALENVSAETSTIIFVGCQLCMNVIAMFTLDIFGRRIACLSSLIGCGCILATVSAYFYLSNFNPELVSSISWLPLVGMILYVIFFFIGLGVLPTLMLSELFSTSIKGKGLCVTNTVFYCLLSVLTRLFFLLNVNFGMHVPFMVFSVCCFCNAAVAYILVPETKGKTLEEIQESLKRGSRSTSIPSEPCYGTICR